MNELADKQSDDGGLRELALFAGAGGGILGGHLLGWRTVCAVEIEPYPASVLCARQNDGILAPFPVWDDIRTFRADNPECAGMFTALRAIAHRLVISGGFPCQDVSCQGDNHGKGDGLDGERSGMWHEMDRVIGEIRPARVAVENSPLLMGRGAAVVLGDLATLGYDAQWSCISASDCNADHERDRFWLYAYPNGHGLERWDNSDTQGYWQAAPRPIPRLDQMQVWPNVSDPRTFGSGNGLANRMDRLEAIGNGQVPRVAATAFNLLSRK